MRILGIIALAIALVGCTGDRVKQGMNQETLDSASQQYLQAKEAWTFHMVPVIAKATLERLS
jgi:hypothetical protein